MAETQPMQYLLVLLLLFRTSNSDASMDICDLANLTVLNATRQGSRVVTAERHSKVTLACWTWCGYVDWDSIMLSGRGLYNGRSAQFSCKGTDGPCERLRVAPTCDHVNTAQDDILKYELSVVVNETFYIECQPHCTYEGADKNIGRTNGFLIHVIDPPKPALVTPTPSAPVTSTNAPSSCVPTASVVSSRTIRTTTIATTTTITSTTTVSSSSSSRMLTTSQLASVQPSSIIPIFVPSRSPSLSIVSTESLTSTPVTPAMPTVAFQTGTTALLSTTTAVFFALFIVLLALVFILLILLLNTKRKLRHSLETTAVQLSIRDVEAATQL